MYFGWMTFLWIGALCASLGSALAGGGASLVQTTGAVSVTFADTNDSVEKEYQKLLVQDDAAQAEVSQWTSENSALKSKGAGAPEAELNRRIRERLDRVGRAYQDFLRRHPAYAKAHLAYGCFLDDRQDEAGAQAQWEKALELDPKNAAACHNLAGSYSESGQVNKAFEYFAKAVELNPSEALYWHSFANALYVLRQRAMPYYGFNEQQVFAKALGMYSNAVRLDPHNFDFAWDFAQTYYSVKPLPADDALRSWTDALSSAHSELEREQVYVQCARVKMLAGRLVEARAQLNAVTNESCVRLKAGLIHSIEEREKPARN